jgi:hypothetical protein
MTKENIWAFEETNGGRNCPEVYGLKLKLHNNEKTFAFNGPEVKLFLDKSDNKLIKKFNLIRENGSVKCVLSLGMGGYETTSDPKLLAILL